MDITPDLVKVEPDSDPLSDVQTFGNEDTIAGQESRLQSPAQVFLKEETIVEEQLSEVEPLTQVFIKEEPTEAQFSVQVTIKDELAVVNGETNQDQEAINLSKDDDLR
jgi:hypothetical protein